MSTRKLVAEANVSNSPAATLPDVDPIELNIELSRNVAAIPILNPVTYECRNLCVLPVMSSTFKFSLDHVRSARYKPTPVNAADENSDTTTRKMGRHESGTTSNKPDKIAKLPEVDMSLAWDDLCTNHR